MDEANSESNYAGPYQLFMLVLCIAALAGLAIAMGSASIAGEESAGTMGLLLGNPKSRTYVLASKGAGDQPCDRVNNDHPSQLAAGKYIVTD